MRHTLLPLYERKVLRREYRVRAVIVACFILSLAGLVGIASIFPVYVRTALERNSQENLLNMIEKEDKDSNLASLQQSVAKSQSLLDLISSNQDEPKPSDIIKDLISLRGDLKFTAISITNLSSTTVSMIVQGAAPTRDSLISFKNRFESAAQGNSVDLPVSELAKNSNIQFSLRLTQKLP